MFELDFQASIPCRPNATVSVGRIDEETLGRLIMFSQYVTAYAGEFYDIDAFDQPGVEYGKKLTFAMMGRPGFSEFNRKIEETRRPDRAVTSVGGPANANPNANQ